MLFNRGISVLYYKLLWISLLFSCLLASEFSGTFEMFTSVDTNEVESELFPLIINTWAFTEAAKNAWIHMTQRGASHVETVVYGCTTCEQKQCDFTVGYGGSPDEKGETTLDAMVMDGSTMNVGAVGGLRRVKNAVGVAKHVLENTKHSILVGELATRFAIDMMFTEEPLSTNKSLSMWEQWKGGHCQPNFWQYVRPSPKYSCGPYRPLKPHERNAREPFGDERPQFGGANHDTITMIAIDEKKRVAVGTSSNGATHKIPGRVGDAPIPGAGGYADASIGAAAATGDGDVMMRFLPSFLAVEEMRRGASPTEAAETAIKRIGEHYPKFFGAVIAANVKGEYGAACNGMKEFPFCVVNPKLQKVTIKRISCFNSQ